jgi:hypothetical protein
MAAPLYFEDLAVGQTFGTGTVTGEPEALKAFAAEFDPQPFHLDEGAARGSPFGGLVASGWHTAALTMRLLVGGELRVVGGLIGLGVEELSWPRPVRPGDVLRVESDRGAGPAPVAVEARPGHRPGAEHDAEWRGAARDGPGRHHGRAPASVVTVSPAQATPSNEGCGPPVLNTRQEVSLIGGAKSPGLS